MEDYLVIIITLIIAVVGVLKGKKKKKTPPVIGSEQQGASTDFWDTIMGGQEESEEKPAVDHVEPECQESQPVCFSSKKSKYTFSAANEGTSDIEDKKKVATKGKKKVLIEGEEFSLRKAVIYSEIMTRKYS